MKNQWIISLVAFLILPSALYANGGILTVTSFPWGAEVIIDGNPTHQMTPMITTLPSGTHTVTITSPDPGWEPETRTVTINGGITYLNVIPLADSDNRTSRTAGPARSRRTPGSKRRQG
jgi:hypothetical protein